jgi:hypothetical protein
MKEFIAKLFFRNRRLWTVVYPDGQVRSCCTLAVANDYRELYGGTVKFLGKLKSIRKDHFA